MEQVAICVTREAGTRLSCTGQFAVACHYGVGKNFVEFPQQFFQPGFLLRSTGVGGNTVRIQSSFVADTDTATVQSAYMGTHFQQFPMLGHATAPADVEVVTDGTESARLMVAQQLLHRIITVATGGRTVDDDEADRVRSIHQQSAFHFGQQGTFVTYLFTSDQDRKSHL